MKEHIRQSNLIEGIDDLYEDLQSDVAWRWLSKKRKLTHDVICKVQKIITLNQPLAPNQRGYYRDVSKTNVRVGGIVCPDWSRVQGLMDEWIEKYGDWEKDFDPIRAHIELEKAHPWVDGNGRTGRMILWWHQKKTEFSTTLFKADERGEYYKLFR